MAVSYFGCRFKQNGLHTHIVFAYTVDNGARRVAEGVRPLDYDEADLLAEYTAQQMWNNGTPITSDSEWAVIQIQVKGPDVIDDIQTILDDWSGYDNVAKLATVEDVWIRIKQIVNTLIRLTNGD
jgi:hypothetical protein